MPLIAERKRSKVPEVQHAPREGELEKLQKQFGEMQQRLFALRGHAKPRLILPELHADNGRIDGQKVADFMSVPLKSLAAGLGLDYKAVHRNPSASGFQEKLRPVKRSLEILHEFFGPKEAVRAWLNTPHPDLGDATALETILKGEASAVRLLLENAWNGVPV